MSFEIEDKCWQLELLDLCTVKLPQRGSRSRIETTYFVQVSKPDEKQIMELGFEPWNTVTFDEKTEFFLFQERRSFEIAKLVCLLFQSTLARISNLEEFTFVHEQFVEGDDDNIPGFWIGLEDVNDVGGVFNTSRFSFVDGEVEGLAFFEEPRTLPWENNQPSDNNNVENCVL